MLKVPVLPALEAVPVGIGPEEVDTMTDQQPPIPADNSTLHLRMEQLRQQVAATTNIPDEARAQLVQMIDEAIAAFQGLDPAAMHLVTGGRTMDAYDDLKDIVEQMLSAFQRSQRWATAWIDPTWRRNH